MDDVIICVILNRSNWANYLQQMHLSAFPIELLIDILSLLPSPCLQHVVMRVNRKFRIIAHKLLTARVAQAFNSQEYALSVMVE